MGQGFFTSLHHIPFQGLSLSTAMRAIKPPTLVAVLVQATCKLLVFSLNRAICCRQNLLTLNCLVHFASFSFLNSSGEILQHHEEDFSGGFSLLFALLILPQKYFLEKYYSIILIFFHQQLYSKF